MAKPIFLIGVPYSFEGNIDEIMSNVDDKLTDYHCLVYLQNTNEFVFKGVYPSDFDEVKFEELKQMVKDSVTAPIQYDHSNTTKI